MMGMINGDHISDRWLYQTYPNHFFTLSTTIYQIGEELPGSDGDDKWDYN